MRDKNETLIFEVDIVAVVSGFHAGFVGVIEFLLLEWLIGMEPLQAFVNDPDHIFEVIGNIFDNLEMLEKTKSLC